MFVNVDWFFLSHRLPIAKYSIRNSVEMFVYTDFTKNNAMDYSEEFSLLQSPISRSSKYFLILLEFNNGCSMKRRLEPVFNLIDRSFSAHSIRGI